MFSPPFIAGNTYLNRNFRFQFHFCAKPYARRYLASTSNRCGRGRGTSVAPFGGSADALAVTWLEAGTPHGMMIPQRSVRSLSWFATRSSAAPREA
jgi:hypothetical protein